MRKKATIKDLASYAGVSVATVSRVINNNGYVSKENREKIIKAIEELKYDIKSYKPARVDKSNIIAVLSSPWKEHTFLPRLNYALSLSANAAGYHTLNIAKHIDNQTIPTIISNLSSTDICGIVITDCQDDELTEQNKQILADCGVPVVLVERALCSELNGVKIDTQQGVYLSTKHLIERRRKNIYYITAPLSGSVERDRLNGFKMAHFDAGIPLKDHQIKICASTQRSSCQQALEEIFSSGDTPDGIVTWSDIFAITTLQFLHHKGIKVPNDISVVGYDDFLASYTSPMLTSIHSPVEEMAEAAINIIKEKENTSGYFFSRTVLLTPKLVIRETS
jgi:LacI family transcriptional regulator